MLASLLTIHQVWRRLMNLQERRGHYAVIYGNFQAIPDIHVEQGN